MQLLGYDIGSSSVKASILDAESGKCIASAYSPSEEMEIISLNQGWAEQHPVTWWDNLIKATRLVIDKPGVLKDEISAIGISYQMHGLVLVDIHGKILRPAIIWCDSRAVEYGAKAFNEIGRQQCLEKNLNSPGNFTASKLMWIKENEPDTYVKIHKIMLPGDYIAWKLSGELLTTPSGLSEGILWDYQTNGLSKQVIDHFGFQSDLFPEAVPNFSIQGHVTDQAAGILGIKKGIPVSYRAGDQPNNAFSLNVMNPGEFAATAGTSGVVYGISDQLSFDPESRVNSFMHVNHQKDIPRIGVLLCINGTGILNAWLKKNVAGINNDYEDMNKQSLKVPPGSSGLLVLPFGNGAERLLGNKSPGCIISGLDFNRHNSASLFRAAHEGIAFSFVYGMEVMVKTGIHPRVIRAGRTNMFLSPVFRDTIAALTGATIELYNTDGAQGAARGAGIGAGIFCTVNEGFMGLEVLDSIQPDKKLHESLSDTYLRWKRLLSLHL